VLINPDYLRDELAYTISFADCALAVGHPANVDVLSQVTRAFDAPIAVLDATTADAAFAAPAHEPATAESDGLGAEAMIIYTSGTTGRPKGCIISNEACLASGDFYAGAGGLMRMEPGRERLYAPFPSFHMSVSVFALNTITKLANCLVTRDAFHVSTWWSDVVSTRATIVHYLGIVPPILLRTPEGELEKRHRVKFGQGAGVDPSVREGFERRFGFPLVEGWGMTETARAIHNADEPRCLEPRAFGRPRLPLQVQVVDENDRTVPFGAPGELLVRSAGPDPRKGFFSGYLKQPQETEAAWRGGWFHTGDIVTQREDGMLFFVERRKNIIRRSGENISAAAVEDAIVTDPAVKLVAVIAVPDDLHDEEIMACIRVDEGIAPGAELAAAIVERARDKLAHYKLPGWIAFLDEIPVTGTQKVRKGLLFGEGCDPRHDPRSFDMRALKRRLREAAMRPEAANVSSSGSS
jgi:acyl-coenzyme A synthetase/AMP-(fatty) acid ligase